jgi:hypothetical protein
MGVKVSAGHDQGEWVQSWNSHIVLDRHTFGLYKTSCAHLDNLSVRKNNKS